ncbi:unnamed protein product [Moneuplotes crassus]|uniref:Uncharacterized protein n=1 Tax=Euplotes crassus TaxID=5936 RepID=A0AAD1XZN2_EUPCR|nr:unnamed protein product [Moneuplotes crassus]
MAKILTLTIVLIALLTSAHALNIKEAVKVEEESTAIFAIGEDGDYQLFGFSFRGIFFSFVRSWLKGYIAGYEGRFSVPGDCVDKEFQSHVSERGWQAFTTVLTFWRHSSETIQNRVLMFLIVVADEVMNDCGGGLILIDLFNLWSDTGSIWRFGLRIFLHALYTFPLLAVWGVVSIACNLIFFFWGGGFGAGNFLQALIVGMGWPWD